MFDARWIPIYVIVCYRVHPMIVSPAPGGPGNRLAWRRPSIQRPLSDF